MRSAPYDVIIIGGGITGAGIFRELAHNNTSCLLVDKGDFAAQTSARSSKMLHGGIRYLEQYDFELVWEALHEKNYWLKMAPHLCREEEFFLPTYKDSLHPHWMIRMGLLAYDVLSGLKNTPHRSARLEEFEQAFPGVRSSGFVGCGVYHDGIMDDNKMALDCIFDASLFSRAQSISYHSLIDLRRGRSRWSVTLLDRITGQEYECLAKHVVFSLGPFTDKILGQYPFLEWTPRLLPSKGSHIWIDRKILPIQHAMVITDKNGRVIFVIPHAHAILVGTTEVSAGENYYDVLPDQDEIDYLLSNLADYFPKTNITREHVLSSYAGIRPLVREGDLGDRSKTARHHKLFYPAPGLHVIMGGKYTTFRVMARHLVAPLMRELGKPYSPNKSDHTFKAPSLVTPYGKQFKLNLELIERVIKHEQVRTIPDLIQSRLNINGPLYFDKNKHDFKNYDQMMLEIEPLAKKYSLSNTRPV